MILELQHIYKNYDQDKLVVPVLKDVSLQIEEGEYVAIMGPSGSCLLYTSPVKEKTKQKKKPKSFQEAIEMYFD